MASVQSGDPVPLLVSLKAVDPRSIRSTETVELDPADAAGRRAATDSTVVVADDLLVRLNAKVGDR